MSAIGEPLQTGVNKEIARQMEAEGDQATVEAITWCILQLGTAGFGDAARWLYKQAGEPEVAVPTVEVGRAAPKSAPAAPALPATETPAAPAARLLAMPALDSATSRQFGFTGNCCPQCESFAMVRNGTCEKCSNCGATTGCS